MTLNDYQKKAAKTDILGDGSSASVFDAAYIAKVLGLTGEAGEVAEKYKKIIRDKKGIVSEADKFEIAKELGDVLWYVAILSRYLGLPFEEVAQMNLDKLAARKSKGVLHGKGDNR